MIHGNFSSSSGHPYLISDLETVSVIAEQLFRYPPNSRRASEEMISPHPQ